MFNSLSEFESYIKEKNIEELKDISLHINRDKYPERYLIVEKYTAENKSKSAKPTDGPKIPLTDNWWFLLFVSTVLFYKGTYLLFISDEEEIRGGLGGALLQFIKTEFGTVPVSFVLFCIACFFLLIGFKKFRLRH